jgi:hypothetical protein
MSTEHATHPDPVTPPVATAPAAHTHAEEVHHAWHHFRENAYFFAGFLALVLCAVVQFELSGQTNYWWIFGLGSLRFALIGFFLFSLVRPFSLVVGTILFTILFFGGMVFLSIWDSQLGDPIVIKSENR